MDIKTIIATGVACILSAAVTMPSSIFASEQLDRSFNSYMIRAYERLVKDDERHHKGYDKSSWFTKNLNYGKEDGAIAAHNAPFTMCNAAVTETFVEAINLYARDNPNWMPQKAIPTSAWKGFKWDTLKPHLFGHSYYEYEPLEGIPLTEIDTGLKKDIDDFHSNAGMYKAFENFGLGYRIKFKDARPGDVISLDREHINREGKERFSGHSVVFLGFLNRQQKLQRVYNAKSIVGFKYFSSQGTRQDGGLDERWAYFKGAMCPFVAGYSLPSDIRYGGCADAVDTPENRSANPPQLPGQKRDCCIKREGPDGVRVARLKSPSLWSFEKAMESMKKRDSELQKHVKEFIERRKASSVQIGLIATGVNIVGLKEPEIAQRFADRVNKKFGVDLKAVSATGVAPEASLNLAKQISDIAPRAIINEANKTVRESDKNRNDADIRQSGQKAIQQLNDIPQAGIANVRLDGQSVD
ncbi:MAG: hypothetical protein QOF07_1938 [Bradyrhizobium sp.]|jgi:hypothetical protein|nr:hypothetical protein [Bradyrhizobium sp.]